MKTDKCKICSQIEY